MQHLEEDPCEHFFTDENMQGLADRGYLVLENALPRARITSLRDDSLNKRAEGLFKQAGIDQGKGYRMATDTRSDMIHWWDPQGLDPVQQRCWRFVQCLRQQLNRHMFLGLLDVELHYAIYPPGAFYGKHVDQFRGNNLRKVSLVLFLNDTWEPEDGGQLRQYETQGPGYRDVLPLGGTLALFYSDLVPHEVLPTRRERLSLTGWLKIRP